jgi:hypothetical protein
VLVAVAEDGRRVVGRYAERGESYCCPACRQNVILKRGRRVVPHYAHAPASDCANRGESLIHLALKDQLWQALRATEWGRTCELEYPLTGNPGDIDRRADLYVVTPSCRVALEVQVSPLSCDALDAKLHDYAELGCRVLYVVSPTVLPGYKSAGSPRALDGAAVRVPQWVAHLALQQDPWTDRSAWYCWDADELWLVAHDSVYRYREWEGREDFDELARTFRLHLVSRAAATPLPPSATEEYARPAHPRPIRRARSHREVPYTPGRQHDLVGEPDSAPAGW